MNEADIALKPKNLTMEEAASIPLVGLTAWQVLVERAKLKKGQKVLIHAGSGGVGTFHGQQRKKDTHASTSDPDSRLYRKAAGREAKLCYMGHAAMENRHGLAVAGTVTFATGTAERRASEIMLKAQAKKAGRRITVGE